jgi:hypothetical protein
VSTHRPIEPSTHWGTPVTPGLGTGEGTEPARALRRAVMSCSGGMSAFGYLGNLSDNYDAGRSGGFDVCIEMEDVVRVIDGLQLL